MRVVAILAVHNEERFIAGCLEHLIRQDVQVYLIDNQSDDRTVAIAEAYFQHGLLGIETFPHTGTFNLRGLLKRKQQLASLLDADWFLNVDADEIHLPPRGEGTLAQAFARVEAQGFNAVNFVEFTFIPTREAPDHDHPAFRHTLRSYYPFVPRYPWLLRAWKRQPGEVELADSAGHRVDFPGLQIYPESFPMKHYLFLSIPQALRKYTTRKYDPGELKLGWHEWRPHLKPGLIDLPDASELRTFSSDAELDDANPRKEHYLAQLVRFAQSQPALRITNEKQMPLAKPRNGPETQENRSVFMPICIAGMHRSGTSMVARLLNLCGLYLGPESDLVAGRPDNSEGFWENSHFVDLNDEILAALGGSWDMPPVWSVGWELQSAMIPLRAAAARLVLQLGLQEPWGWKDPRNSITLDFWKCLLHDLKVVVCLRNPLEVAQSLKQRGHSSIAFGLNLWLTYNQRVLAATQLAGRVVTHYDAYLTDLRSELRRITALLNIPASEQDLDRAAAAATPALHHHRAMTKEMLTTSVPFEVVKLYMDLCAEAGPVYQAALESGLASEDHLLRSVDSNQHERADALKVSHLESQRREMKQELKEPDRLRAALMVHDTQLQQLGDELTRRYVQIGQLHDELRQRDGTIAQSRRELMGRAEELEALWYRIACLESERAWLRDQIRQMQATKVWQLGAWYWRLHSGVSGLVHRVLPSERSGAE